jgi:glycosyltransferase involved in cell wall biosynthesis
MSVNAVALTPVLGMERKIRILFVIDNFTIGGTERQLVEIINRLDQKKFELFLCCLSSVQSGIQEHLGQSDKVKTILLDVGSIYSISAVIAIYRLIRLIRSLQVDIVQAYFLRAKVLGVLAGKLAGIKTISCMRDLGLSINYKTILPIMLADRWASGFLVNSQSIGRYLVKRHRINPDRIDVITNGVDMNRFRPANPIEKAEGKKRLGIDPGHIVIGAIANLKPVKGLESFIRAAAIVFRQNPRTRFVIVGEGTLRESLRTLAANLGMEDNIVFTGSSSDVWSFLSAFDIGVLCSLSEGFSNAILEYLAMGLPVVATNVGGNVEQVLDQETGFLVPPENPDALAQALLKLVRDEDLRRKMSDRAVRDCQTRFDMDRMIRQLENYYLEVSPK